MLNSRARLGFFSVPVLVLLVVGYWWFHSLHVQAQGSQSNPLRALQQERLATLRRLVQITSDQFKNGQAGFDELRSATRARDEAELDLCTSNQERLAVLERVVADAKTREEQETKLVANKLAPETALLRATADRLQQQIALERARAK